MRRKMLIEQHLARFINIYRSNNLFGKNKDIVKSLDNTHAKWAATRSSDSCILLGNGPSLNEIPFDCLSQVCTFAANFFVDHPSAAIVNPSFYCVIDGKLATGVWAIDLIDRVLAKFPDTHLFLDVRWRRLAKFEPYLENERIWWILPNQMPNYFSMPATSLRKGILGMNVVAAMLSIATSMGFNRIGIAGVDGDGLFRQLTEQSSHAFPTERDASIANFESMVESVAASAQMLWAWNGICKNYKKTGIDLINICRGGIMDCFPRQKFSSFVEDN